MAGTMNGLAERECLQLFVSCVVRRVAVVVDGEAASSR
jgi:hypothetical protein